MSQLRRFVREIPSRSLWQVLGVYLVTSWVVYQVVLGVYEGAGLPDWVPVTALVLLLVALPVVLATAFIQEGGPGQARGMSRSRRADVVRRTAEPVSTHRRRTVRPER